MSKNKTANETKLIDARFKSADLNNETITYVPLLNVGKPVIMTHPMIAGFNKQELDGIAPDERVKIRINPDLFITSIFIPDKVSRSKVCRR